MPNYNELILQNLASPGFLRATFSGPTRFDKTTTLRRVMVRSVDLNGAPHLLVARFDDRKDITHNYPLAEIPTALADVLAIGFANVHLTTTTEELDLRLTKKLALQIGRKKRKEGTSPTTEPHNRPKQVPLPEGLPDKILQLMGIMTSEGQIRSTMRPKFTQINEFLKLLDPLLETPAIRSLAATRPLTILDCGSGSAYLTIATHHYLNHVKKIPAHLLGIDLNPELIQKSTDLSQSLPQSTVSLGALGDSVVNSPANASNLEFLTGRIGEIENHHPDIVLALHACDTATDDAIAQAVKSNAQILLAVPCCHKNLNHSLHAEILDPIHHHGILHQRLADLATDALRAQILRIVGYRTEVIEFISPEHTAKNLMIRAQKIANKTPHPQKLLSEYIALKSFFQVTPYLETILSSHFPK